MKVYEAIADVLREQHVDVVFGLVGDATLYAMNEFQRRGGRFIPVAHESGMLLAAAGYHSVSGRIGVGSVTHGPGLANTVNSLYGAVKHRVPSVLVAGDTASTDADNLQDIDQHALITATGALFEPARSAETAAGDLRRAFRRALAARLPVVYNIPIDYQWADVEHRMTAPVRIGAPRLAPDPEQIEEAVGALPHLGVP